MRDTGPPATTDILHEAATLAAVQPTGAASTPETIGGYRLLRLLGSGGMGEVYEAEDTATGRHVALKLIAAEYAASADAVGRFRQEGRLASAISHPRCVFVLAADEEAGRPYIVMELMPGATLGDLVEQQGPLRPEQAVAQILDVIEGLQEAHRLGVIHRDVKPSNCFVESNGRVKVGDFGLAKSLIEDVRLTRSGAFLGTPLYASPEQIRREPLDEQTDVYSVAATLYYLLCGKAPFQGGDAAACIARIVSDEPPSLRSVRPEIPRGLERVVLRGLERDRKRRWRNLEDFRTALLPFMPGQLATVAVGMSRRFIAFLVDAAILSLITSLVISILAAATGMEGLTRVSGGENEEVLMRRLRPGELLLADLSTLPVWLIYFGVIEGLWGCSLGKRLLRLRVRAVRDLSLPGLGRALLRALVFCLLLKLGSRIGILSLYLFQGTLSAGLVASVSGLLNLVGLVVLLCTMTTRNGYRCLHELLSGTRTIWLPPPRRQWTFDIRPAHVDTTRLQQLPRRIGPFVVRGSLSCAEHSRVLLGHDPSLGREVFICLCKTGAALEPVRHDVNRPTRLRWLAGGQHDGALWDAFLAPAGGPLTGLVSDGGPLPWPQARSLLEQLTEELIVAEEEGTLPAVLTVSQVWIQADGRIQLLDFPLSPGDAEPGEKDGAATNSATQRALTFLGHTAVVALEGKPRPPAQPWPGPLRVPVPLHAARFLNRLLEGKPAYPGLREFAEDLQRSRDLRTVVTRGQRVAQMSLFTLLFLLSLVLSDVVGSCVPSWGQLDTSLSQTIGRIWRGEESAPSAAAADGTSLILAALVWPLLGILSAYLMRGGLTLRAANLAVVRSDGHLPSRLRCAWRAVLVWGPMAALIVLALAWNAWLLQSGGQPDPSVWLAWLARTSLQAAVIVVLLNIFLILWSPTRSWQDRLAGTCLVPR